MNITEVRVKLMRNRSDRLRAFCSITIDGDFVVHDLRVIEGRKGLFVAMPSRKLTDNCPRCSAKNELRAKFCGDCGAALSHDREDQAAAEKSHVDVAHPINTPCREMLQDTVLAAYREEAEKGGDGSGEEDGGASEFDDSPDDTVDETESQYADAEIDDTELLFGDVREEPPAARSEQAETPAGVQSFDDVGEFDVSEEDDLPAFGVAEPLPGGDLVDEDPSVGEDSEAAAASGPAEASPETGDATRPRTRSRSGRKQGGFGEGIF